MKLISTNFLLAIILLMAPAAAHAIPTLTIDNAAVTFGASTACGTGCTSFNIPTGPYNGLTVSNFSGTATAALKVIDGTNSDTLTLTNIIFRNNDTSDSGVYNISYRNTFSSLATDPQNYQLYLSGLFAAPAGSSTAGDKVTLMGQVSFTGGSYPTTAIGDPLTQTVGSNSVGPLSPLRRGPTSIGCGTGGCLDTLMGDLTLSMLSNHTFKMSGSAGVDRCDTDLDCDASFAIEVAAWQELQVPEPGSLLLILSGLGVLALAGKKQRFFQ